jgi:hypothetical protein
MQTPIWNLDSNMSNKIDQLSQDKQIEYYLGKDQFKDHYFAAHFPEAWEIEFCHDSFKEGYLWKDMKNTTVVFEDIEFKFNNLGYRSNYDYHIDDLKTKRNILCLGDSDTFGSFRHHDELWTSCLQQLMPDYNIINVSMPGWSFDTLARTGVCILKSIPVEHVLVINSSDGRREFVSKNYKKIISKPFGITNVPYEEYWDYIDWQSNNYNHFKNDNLLRFAAQAHNANYINLIVNGIGKYAKFDGSKYDRGMFGPLTHQAMANWFYKRIMNLPSLFEELK